MDHSILNENLNDQVGYSEFFEALGYRPEDRIYLRHFSDRSSENGAVNLEVELRRIKAIIPALKRANESCRGIFHVVNGGGQKDSEVKVARAIFADFDDCSSEKLIEILNGFPLPPSIIIKTGRGFHCYWFLQAPDPDLKKWKMCQERLNNHLHSDPTIKNPSRVMRLYGFLHQKKDPVMVTLIKFDPELRYTLDDFDRILPQIVAQPVADPQARPDAQTLQPAKIGTIAQQNQLRWFREWAKEHDITIWSAKSDSEKYIIEVNCPWEDQHTEGAGAKYAFVYIWSDGTFGFKCFHSHCSDRGWKQYRTFYEPEYAERAETVDIDLSDTLTRFHRTDKRGNPTGVFDAAILEDILAENHIFVLGGIPHIYRDGVYRRDDAGTKLRALIRERILPEFQRAPTEKRVYDLIVHTDSIQVEADDINHYPKHWVCFRNGMFDPVSWKMLSHDPKYLAVNQVPHEFDPGTPPQGPAIDSWLEFCIPAADDRQMMLEFCGYCMTIDIGLQIMLLLLGLPSSGKSTLIKLLEKAVGNENTSHVSLKELTQRFASYGLMGKLLNTCADLEISALEDVSIIKKALGEDALRAEAKGKDAISIRNHAKFVFSTNELPLILNERTNGFFRRLRILRMDQVPDKPEPDFFEKLEVEIDHFIYLCMEALHNMLERKALTESAGSRLAVAELRKDSDTVEAWISDACWLADEVKIDRKALHNSYQSYCDEMGRTALTRNAFYRALRTKGFEETKNAGTRMFKGIRPVESAK